MRKEPDWGLNLQICDDLNAHPSLGPYFIKYIKPRLDHSQQSVGLLALHLLSSVVDNCVKMRPSVADQEFLDFMVETLPKSIRQPLKKHLFGGRKVTNIEEIARCDKLLALIRKWSTAFKTDDKLKSFNDTFRKLSLDGVKFPLPQPGEEAPVDTPDVNIEVARQERSEPPARAVGNEQKATELIDLGLTPHAPETKETLPFPGADFVNIECRGAMEAVHLLTQVLNESDPREDLRRNEIAQTMLAETVTPYFERFTKRVTAGGCRNDRELNEHIIAIDALNEVKAFYDGLLKGTRTRNKSYSAAAVAAAVSQASSAVPASRAQSGSGSQPRDVPKSIPTQFSEQRGNTALLPPALAPPSSEPIPAIGPSYNLGMPIGAQPSPRTGLIPAVIPSPASSSTASSNDVFLNARTSQVRATGQPLPPIPASQSSVPTNTANTAPSRAEVESDPFLALLGIAPPSEPSQTARLEQRPREPSQPQQPASSPLQPPIVVGDLSAVVLPAPTAPPSGRTRVRGGSAASNPAEPSPTAAAGASQSTSPNPLDPLALLGSLNLSGPERASVPPQNPSAPLPMAPPFHMPLPVPPVNAVPYGAHPSSQVNGASEPPAPAAPDPFLSLLSSPPQPVSGQEAAGVTPGGPSQQTSQIPDDDPFLAIAFGK